MFKPPPPGENDKSRRERSRKNECIMTCIALRPSYVIAYIIYALKKGWVPTCG